MTWRLLLLPIFLLLAVMAANAVAQNVGVVVRTVKKPPAERGAVEALLAEGAAARGLVAQSDLLSAARDQYRLGAVRRQRLHALEKASVTRRAAWRHYLAAEPEQALALLAEARGHLMTALDLDGAAERLADNSLRRGAVHLFAGQRQQANTGFAMAARLDSHRPVSSPEFSPQVVAAYQAARRSPANTTVLVNVATQPDARVEINGQTVTEMPVRLVPGDHVVVVRKRGFVPVGQVVTVREPLTIKVQLVADDDALVLANDSDFRVGTDASVAKTLLVPAMVFAELDEVWLVGVTWQRGTLALLGQRCVQGPLRCGPIKEVGLLEEAVDDADLRVAIDKLLDEWKAPQLTGADPTVFTDSRLLSPEWPTKKIPLITKQRWWKNPWVWVGAAAAASAITGTVIVLGDSGTGGSRVLVPACTFGGC